MELFRNMKRTVKVLFPTALCILFLFAVSCQSGFRRNLPDPGLDGVLAGLYDDYGATGVEAVMKMLDGIHCRYELVDSEVIRNEDLQKYSFILFPGGDWWKYRRRLSISGMRNIREYIKEGGNYLGICGGAYFAADGISWHGWENEPRKNFHSRGLGIFPGKADGPLEEFSPDYFEFDCGVNLSELQFITNGLPEAIEYLYSFGPGLIPDDGQPVTVIGKSDGNNIVITANEYGNGKVFLTSLHPEDDKNNDSWLLVQNAVFWFLNGNKI